MQESSGLAQGRPFLAGLPAPSQAGLGPARRGQRKGTKQGVHVGPQMEKRWAGCIHCGQCTLPNMTDQKDLCLLWGGVSLGKERT